MKKWFVVMGIFFIVVMVGMSVFFFLKYDQTRKEKVPEPNLGTEPQKPNAPNLSDSKWIAFLEGRQISTSEAMQEQAEAQAYEAAISRYNQELEAYTQNKIAEENRYQQALRDRDSRARSYLLYMVILDCVLAVLVFLSFFLASRIKEEVMAPSVAGEVEGTTENTKD